jgi:hypothetical protein
MQTRLRMHVVALACTVAFMGSCAGIVLVLESLAGCQAVAASNLPPDIAAEIACVQQAAEAGITSVPELAAKCVIPEVTTAIDLVVLLLDSKAWTTAHPSVATALGQSVSAARADQASQKP